MMQFRFESIFPLVVLARALVGMPAIILKQSAIWFLRNNGDGPRLRLLGASIGAGAAVGIATIIVHAWLSGGFGPAIDAGTAAAALALVGAVDGLLWLRFVDLNGAQSQRSAAIWLIGGNAWIPWGCC
jgi:hypothetical protein